jgi:hypothetical protein
MIADRQAAWSGGEAVMKRMPRKRPPPAAIIPSRCCHIPRPKEGWN